MYDGIIDSFLHCIHKQGFCRKGVDDRHDPPGVG